MSHYINGISKQEKTNIKKKILFLYLNGCHHVFLHIIFVAVFACISSSKIITETITQLTFILYSLTMR